MQLQEGKRYVRRDGQLTGFITRDSMSPEYPYFDRDNAEIYREDGSWAVLRGNVTEYDIVAEFDSETGTALAEVTTTQLVLDEIEAERIRQDKKWGTQNHGMAVWTMILAEEVGEAAREANDYHFSKRGSVELDEAQRERGRNYRAELVQVAAVAVAMIESFDRNEAKGE